MDKQKNVEFICNLTSENKFDIGSSWFSGFMVFKHVLSSLILLLMGSCCFADSNNVLTLEVAAPRPMAEAVIALGEQLQCPITYEDIPFENPADLRYIVKGSKTLIPYGGQMSFSYRKTSDPFDIIDRLATQYKMEGNTGEFYVTKSNRVYNIIPLRYKNKAGKLVHHQSILDTRISLLRQNSYCFDVINAICTAVTETNTRFRIVHGSLHRLLMDLPFSCDINDVPARNVINQVLECSNKVLKEKGVLFTWQLRFSPTHFEQPFYVLEFRKIRLGSPDSIKMRTISARPMATAVQILEKRFRTVITYEDPLYTCSCDVIGGPGQGDKGLRGGIINIDWDHEKDSAEEVLNLLSQSPIKPRDVEPMFNIGKGLIQNYHVYPLFFKDEQGNFVPRMSVMDNQITFGVQEINATMFLQEICGKLSDMTNENVVLGSISKELSEKLRNHTFSSVFISKQIARDCLDEFIGNIGRNISWQLIHDPGSEEYTLTPYYISRPRRLWLPTGSIVSPILTQSNSND